jgi:hypothetical protein
MMFDDHEITDDWNRTGLWKSTVMATPLGRRIISNGLAAFWAFQAWGNDPDRFDPEALATALKQREAGLEEVANQVLNRGHWGYFAPGKPTVAVLDERTRRGFDGPDAAPWRIARDEMYERFREIRGQFTSGELLICVAPGPVFSPFMIDTLQGIATPLSGGDVVDLESWIANAEAFENLLTRIARLQPLNCLFLSGDVHYGYVILAELHGVPAGRSVTPFVQFTSSALKNPSGTKAEIGTAADRTALSKPFRAFRIVQRFLLGRADLRSKVLAADRSPVPTGISGSNLGRVRVSPSMQATLELLSPGTAEPATFTLDLVRDPTKREWRMWSLD